MKKLYFSILTIFVLFASITVKAQSPDRTNSSAFNKQNASAEYFPGFYAFINNNIVVIRWQAQDESNVDHYILERGADSIHFAPLHEVVTRGLTGSQTNYEDADSYPAALENYYRLKTVTNDGQIFYSPTIMVDMSAKLIPAVKPSVLNQGSSLYFDNYAQQPLFVIFFNTAGMRTAAYLVNSSYFNINTSGWGKGLYFYRISDETHPLINTGKILVL
jgi:hypothetical protein